MGYQGTFESFPDTQSQNTMRSSNNCFGALVLAMGLLNLPHLAYAQTAMVAADSWYDPSGAGSNIANAARSPLKTVRPAQDIHGADTILLIGGGSKAVIRFGMDNLPAGLRPSQILRANLVFYVSSAMGRTGSLVLSKVTSPWTEAEISWSNPPMVAAPIATVAIPGAQLFYSMDVTLLVQEWLASPSSNFGLQLSAESPETAVAIDSKENDTTSQPARLEIVLDPSTMGRESADSASTLASLVGPVGPTGPAGPKGLRGDIGPQGPQGERGLQGPKGDVGLAGTQGIQGLKGDIGPAGPQGPQGLTGLQGPKGDVGPAGPQGERGLQGPKGDVGSAGTQGIQGLKGDIGPAGPQGPQGLTGLQGPTGPQGPAGASGVITVFGNTGAPMGNLHAVMGSTTATSGNPRNVVVALSGAAAFANANTYRCFLQNRTTASDSLLITRSSGTAFTITVSANSGSFDIDYYCVGN